MLAAAAITLAVLGGALPARAAIVAGQPAPGAQIAAALRKSPLYVDPSLASAFPAAARKEILAAIGKAPTPVYVVAVPLISGGPWATTEQFADVIQADVGGPGIYLTLDEETGTDWVDAWTWPSDPQEIDAPPYHAEDAALTADSTPYTGLQPAPVWQTFLTTIQLIDSGKAYQAYQALMAADARPGSANGQAASSSSDGGPIAGGVLAAIAAGTGAVVLARRRRRRLGGHRANGEPPAQVAGEAPAQVVAAARAEDDAGLHARAEAELIELGTLLEQPGPADADGRPGSYSDQAAADLTRALDAYTAAAQVLDGDPGILDLAGVLVLTQMGRCAAAAAQARQDGRPVPSEVMLCFFNPLHGPGTNQARWPAPAGPYGRHTIGVHACDSCATAVGQRLPVDTLTGSAVGRHDVPWYESGTVWAATGYGQFSSDDLLRRILERTAAKRPGADHAR